VPRLLSSAQLYVTVVDSVRETRTTDANYMYVNMYTCIYAYSKFYYLDLEVPLYNFDYVS